jgi:hypothetical protein
MRSARRLLICVGFAATAAGCGIHDPYQTHPPATAASTTSGSTIRAGAAPTEHDGPSQPPTVTLPASAAAPTPQDGLARFARLYGNWTAAQLTERSKQLAAISTGQARAQALQLATRAAVLQRYQVTNTATVVAIGPGRGEERGRWAVVTNESTSGTGPYLGLPATSHVSWATVQRQHTGYVVSVWYPAS